MPKFQEYDAQTGIKTTYHDLDDAGRVVIQKEYDAKPMLAIAAEARATTDGDKWGDMRHVGFIPMAELGKMMRQDGGIDKARLNAWLKQNPDLVTFNKFLK